MAFYLVTIPIGCKKLLLSYACQMIVVRNLATHSFCRSHPSHYRPVWSVGCSDTMISFTLFKLGQEPSYLRGTCAKVLRLLIFSND